MGFSWTNNGIGLTTQILTPTGPCCQPGWGPYETQTISYSMRNEDTLHVTSLSGQSTTVHNRYDEEENLLSATRSFSPNPRGIDSLTTSWQYDRANRAFRQTEPDGSVEQRWFDPASNVDSVLSRRGRKISMTYDSLNRVRTRSLPAFNDLLPASRISPATGVNQLQYAYSWGTDGQSFEYFSDGQVSRAVNKDATVTRTFHPNGRLLSENLEIKSTDRATTHSYTTTYRYDRNGRRSSVLAPALFAGDSILYRYNPSWGALDSVKDIAGNLFSFTYNERSELTRIGFGGGISEYFAYDDDGRLRVDSIMRGTGAGFPYFPVPKLRRFVVGNRNARGQILTSTDSAMSDQVEAIYSGLGYVEAAHMRQDLFSVRIGGPVTYASVDTTVYDGLGNILATMFRDSVYSFQWDSTRRTTWNWYTPKGRLSARLVERTAPRTSYCCDSTGYSYDAAGNNFFEAMFDFSHTVKTERAGYYGPDEKLLATDTRESGRRTFEEYRYDALGRRVWVRSVKTCEGGTHTVDCHAPFVRRTIWDGMQELAEIQVPVDVGDPPADPGDPGVEEMDTGYPLFGYPGLDPNTFYGRVVYRPGLAVDQPLSVTRYDYRDAPSNGGQPLTWPRFTWQIYWNYQGLPAYGTLTTGHGPIRISWGKTRRAVLWWAIRPPSGASSFSGPWPTRRTTATAGRSRIPVGTGRCWKESRTAAVSSTSGTGCMTPKRGGSRRKIRLAWPAG